MTTRELADIDKRVLWHPFTQQQSWCEEEPLIIERAAGCTLYDTDGHAYIDGVSSLWCNVHGHAHPQIDRAVRAQLERVAHTTMLGLSHPPAIELGRRDRPLPRLLRAAAVRRVAGRAGRRGPYGGAAAGACG